jgi:hypothetical protein
MSITSQEYDDYLASNVLPKINKSAQSEQSVVK